MESIWKRIPGTARVELRAAEPELLLERCRERGMRFWRIRPLDGCTMQMELWQRDLPELRRRTEESGGELEILELKGGSRCRSMLRRRRALLLGLLAAALLSLISSAFVWQVQVQGCRNLSSGRVLRALADCGVAPGSFRPGIRTELVRSRMLSELPELEWMTVNISGSRATVLVREREKRPEILEPERPGEIRASRSGIVEKVTVLNGRALVQPGDAVLEGELLVSGDLESLLGESRSVRAMAEIRAETWHELTAVCPLEMLRTREPQGGRSGFSLQIGKKRLIFWPSSGKGLDECDTIVHEYNLGVEGLFSTPLSLIVRQDRQRSPAGGEKDRTEEMKEGLLRLLEERIDGEVLETSFSAGRSDGLLVVTLRARCSENIAQLAEPYP